MNRISEDRPSYSRQAYLAKVRRQYEGWTLWEIQERQHMLGHISDCDCARNAGFGYDVACGYCSEMSELDEAASMEIDRRIAKGDEDICDICGLEFCPYHWADKGRKKEA